MLFAVLPWSVDWPAGAKWNLTVPAEPLMAVCGLGLLWEILREGKLKLAGPAWIPLIWVVWQTMSAAFSTMPPVSWKYWLVETAHWGVFFIALYRRPYWWPGLMRVFAWSLAGVAVYALVHHGMYQFRADQANLAPMPFFADHTVYGVVVVMVLLAVCSIAINLRGEGAPGVSTPPPTPPPKGRGAGPHFTHPSRIGMPKVDREQAPLPLGGGDGGGALFLLTLCLIFSRAAWLSLLLSVFFGAAVYFRKYRPWFLSAVLLAIAAGFIFRENIGARLSADVSTMERWNRYSCAWRMSADRPWTGFGPGTFQFQYLPYQKAEEMTRLSITEPITRRHPGNYGRGGGAHSEYLRALAETGWPGAILWVLLAGVAIGAGLGLYRRDKLLIWLFITLSLVSFLLHGFLNNFLHDGRVAALVWGQMAVLMAAFSAKAVPTSAGIE